MSLLISNFFWGDISLLADQKMGLQLIPRIFFGKNGPNSLYFGGLFSEIARFRCHIVFGMVPFFFYFLL
jgi:hypothetical protein